MILTRARGNATEPHLADIPDNEDIADNTDIKDIADMIPKQPRFRLFRLTKPMNNGCTHAGEVWINGKLWAITARVAETEYGRQFVGDVEAPGATFVKKPPQDEPQNDLVSQAAVEPLDDGDKLKELPF